MFFCHVAFQAITFLFSLQYSNVYIALRFFQISSASSGSLADSPKVSDVHGDSSSLSSTGK